MITWGELNQSLCLQEGVQPGTPRANHQAIDLFLRGYLAAVKLDKRIEIRVKLLDRWMRHTAFLLYNVCNVKIWSLLGVFQTSPVPDFLKREYRALKFPAESDMYGLAAREPETRRSFVSPNAFAY